jgi:hypothetical protein
MSVISRQRSYLRRGTRSSVRSTASDDAPIPPFGPPGPPPIPMTDPSLVTYPVTGPARPVHPDPTVPAPWSSASLGGAQIPPPLASPGTGSAPIGAISNPADVLSQANRESIDTLIAEMQSRVFQLEEDNTLLHTEWHLLKEENLKLNTAVAGLRMTVADLEVLVLQEQPHTRGGERDRPKPKLARVAPKTGGARSRQLAKQRRLVLDDASSGGETSSDEERTRKADETAALGPAVPGLTELTTRRPEFRVLLSYRHYRLQERSQAGDAATNGKMSSQIRRMGYHVASKFNGEQPIQVLDFLKVFREAADVNELTEASAAVILPYFLEGTAKVGLTTKMKRLPEGMPKYPAAVHWLLQSFASEAIIAAAHQRVYTARQAHDEDEGQFASRLNRYAGDAGAVFTEDALITAFVDGLHPFASNLVRSQVLTTMTFAEVQLLAEQAGNASRALEKNQKAYPRAAAGPTLASRGRPILTAMAESHRRDPEMYSMRSGRNPAETRLDEGLPVEAVYATGGTHLPGYGREDSFSEYSPSELSSIAPPSRGWDSVVNAATPPSEQAMDQLVEMALALDARGRTCHLCLDPNHFLMDCPLLGVELKLAIQAKREAKYGPRVNRPPPPSTSQGDRPPPTYPYRRGPPYPGPRPSEGTPPPVAALHIEESPPAPLGLAGDP